VRRFVWAVLGVACQSAPVDVAAAPPPPAPAVEAPPPRLSTLAGPYAGRIVAIGDLHGDLAGAVEVLRLAGLVDADARWSGGDTIFVQTGDVTDRGPDSKALIDLLERLEVEARATGGQVIPLVGNHEAMNVLGDWRYVDPGDVAAYGGVEARRAAFGPTGESGAAVRGNDALTVVGDALFTHGGLTAEWAGLGVDSLNDAVRRGLDGGDPRVLGEDGPLWFRGFALEDEAVACPALDAALATVGVRRMVVGHTTQRTGRITPRCGGKLLLIDVGVAAHYGGHRAALEIVGGDAREITPTGVVDLPDPP
jgi:hypothetical protein